MNTLFQLGQLVSTPGALDAFNRTGENAFSFLSRHMTGDWGDVPEEDTNENDFSVKNGFRILSVYRLKDDTRIWIITEADRSSTTVLLPSEY